MNTAAASKQSSNPQCPFCQSTDAFPKYRLETHRILRCRECDLMWLDPQPDMDDLGHVYDMNYFENKKFFEGGNYIYGYFDYLTERFNKQESYRKIVHHAKSYLEEQDIDGLRLLDVGCGLGFLMDVAHDQGFSVSGVEFNHAAVERLQSKYVFPVVAGDFLEYQNEELFDVITMMDVIEHFRDPFKAFQKVNQLLRPNGLFIFTTMDSDSFVSRLLGTRLEDFRRVREHLYFFSRKTVRIMLEREGFEVLQISFHGHTFNLDFLTDRFKLVSHLVGSVLSAVVDFFHIGPMQIHLNPRTKIIVHARKIKA